MQSDKIEVVSIDAPSNPGGPEEDSRRLADLIPDEATPEPGANLRAEEIHDELLACLADLDDRELQVISHKFGIKVQEPISFRELGRRMGVSHEWVRRIAELALVKIRRAFADAEQWSSSEREARYSKTLTRVNAIASMQMAPAK